MKHFVLHRRLWLLLAALVAVGVWLGLSLLRERDRLQAQEVDRLSTQGRVVKDNLTRQLTAIDHSLRAISQAAPHWLREADGPAQARQMLENMDVAMSSVRTFVVTNAQGVIIYSNRPELVGVNSYQSNYVQAPLQALDPTRLYVSQPFTSVLNNYLINLSRVMLDANGQFAGVVSAAIDPVDFEILLNSVRYSGDMRVALVHGDGLAFISQPHLKELLDQDWSASDTVFSRHVRSQQAVSQFGAATGWTSAPLFAVLHTVAPKTLLMDKPLVVLLSRDPDVLLTPWKNRVFNQTLLYLLLVVVSVGMLLVFQRQRAQKIMITKRLKLATEASGVGIWEFDLVTKRYQWDDAMFTLFGLNPSQASPRNDDWIKLLSPQDLQRMRDATRVTIQHDKPFAMTFQIRRPDGQLRYMRNRAALYSDDEGVPRRLIGATEDVTRRKQEEADLRVAAAAFESHESMLVTNAQVEILRVNQAFTALFGYAAREVLGKNPGMFKSSRHDADFFHAMWQDLAQHHSWQGEIWNMRKNGETFPCWQSITAVCDDAGVVTHYVATQTDITLRKAAEDEVKRLAFIDPLTNLPNRRLLTDRLNQAVTHARRVQGHLALIYVDLDKFKPVNDRYGHAAGDQLLQSVAHRLRTCVRESDTVARVGGDEFVVLLAGVAHSNDALQVAEKIHAVLLAPFHLSSGQSVHISSSAGLAFYPEHGQDEATLSRHADVAMYAAKDAGRDQYVVYQNALETPVVKGAPEATPNAAAPVSP